jgi:hypothetical protein
MISLSNIFIIFSVFGVVISAITRHIAAIFLICLILIIGYFISLL